MSSPKIEGVLAYNQNKISPRFLVKSSNASVWKEIRNFSDYREQQRNRRSKDAKDIQLTDMLRDGELGVHNPIKRSKGPKLVIIGEEMWFTDTEVSMYDLGHYIAFKEEPQDVVTDNRVKVEDSDEESMSTTQTQEVTSTVEESADSTLNLNGAADFDGSADGDFIDGEQHIEKKKRPAKRIKVKQEEIELTPTQCGICLVDFDDKKSLQFHEQEQTEFGKYYCCLCYRAFEAMDLKEKHNLSHVKLRAKFKCKNCFACFRSNASLEKHVAKHDLDEENTFQCYKCERNFASAENLIVHLTSGGIECLELVEPIPLPEKIECHKCKEIFTLKAFKFHLEASKDCDNGMVCRTCGVVFKSPRDRRKHKRISVECGKSGDDKTCRFCKKEFMNRPEMLRHRAGHIGFKQDKCDICGALFQGRSSLSRHIKTVHEAVPEQCPYCMRTCPNKRALTRHVCQGNPELAEKVRKLNVVAGSNSKKRKAEGRKYPCLICLKEFDLFSQLQKHQDERKLIEGEACSFTCCKCEYVCMDQAKFTEHLALHALEE